MFFSLSIVAVTVVHATHPTIRLRVARRHRKSLTRRGARRLRSDLKSKQLPAVPCPAYGACCCRVSISSSSQLPAAPTSDATLGALFAKLRSPENESDEVSPRNALQGNRLMPYRRWPLPWRQAGSRNSCPRRSSESPDRSVRQTAKSHTRGRPKSRARADPCHKVPLPERDGACPWH